ncbi:hypothetical protein BVX94_02945 [bacterium B17]|nr:hypothetical protein BVX94_02945 [bacterium B17]
MRIKAFKGLHPVPDMAASVCSVPYDVVNTEEARAMAKGNEWSFLHVVRPEIDLPEGTDTHIDAVYEKAAENFDRFQKEGVLVREQEDSVYVYRQIMGDHVQSGVIACSNIDDYANGLIKKHEKTRQDKEDDRTKHVLTLNANAGPVFLTYKDNSSIDAIVGEIEKREPLFDLTPPDGIQHTVWRAGESRESLIKAFEEVAAFYIADGHHRAAAAARAGQEKKDANPNHTGEEEYNWFTTVLFPAKQLNILPYNRSVHDLNGKSEAEVIEAIKDAVTLEEDTLPSPDETRKVSMYIGGKWYGLSWDEDQDADPVSALDVSYLQDKILAPILGIDDPRTSTRIDFVGGIRGTEELERLVDSGKGAVAFSMYPCLVEQMMAIADADQIMPPKSTWFEPKLRSGLLIHTLD